MSEHDDILECDSEGCGATVSLKAAKETDLGWGYFEFRGVKIIECPNCAGEDEDDDEW